MLSLIHLIVKEFESCQVSLDPFYFNINDLTLDVHAQMGSLAESVACQFIEYASKQSYGNNDSSS